MQIQLNKAAHGPAWERWVILEDQHGDLAYAGQIVITYSDTTSDAIFDCDIMFLREINDEEIDQLLETLSTIVCGEGGATIYTANEVVSKCFCPDEPDLGGDESRN